MLFNTHLKLDPPHQNNSSAFETISPQYLWHAREAPQHKWFLELFPLFFGLGCLNVKLYYCMLYIKIDSWDLSNWVTMQVPPASKHQDVAAALLSFFLALPEPLLPREALNNQHTFSGRQSALQKLATYVPPSDLAVIEHMIGGHFTSRTCSSDSLPLSCPHAGMLKLIASRKQDKITQNYLVT